MLTTQPLYNVPMCFLRRSHLRGPYVKASREGDLVLNLETVGFEQFGEPWLLTMPGCCDSLHIDLLVHGSAAKTLAQRRCGLMARYVPPQSLNRLGHI